MAIENLPLWPFPANWESDYLERLSWLTDVLKSPSGAEQRRSLRQYPWRELEFEIVANGIERALLDNLLSAYGAGDWHLPLWHEVHLLSAAAGSSDDTLSAETFSSSEIASGEVLVLWSGEPFVYELVEVSAVSAGEVTIASGLARDWPVATFVHPVRRARLTDQPDMVRLTDRLTSSPVRFQLSQANPEFVGDPEASTYQGFEILTMEPDATEDAEHTYERYYDELSNQVATPLRVDTAEIGFAKQSYRWVMRGRDEARAFRSLISRLAGRFQPIWLPTFFADFDLLEDVAADATTITVDRCGYTMSGGPRPGREHICIFLVDDTTVVRQIESTSVTSHTEILTLDDPLPAIAVADVLRISFVALCRLEQDQVEIAHVTDSEGDAVSVLTFRMAPDLRVPNEGFA